MTRLKAALGSLLFLLVAPGVVAGLVPYWLTGWHGKAAWPLQLVGAVLVGSGIGVLLNAFARFVLEGRGTPAPVAPTQRLVIGGLYRFVRNPMYLAVGAIIVGQALILASVALMGYAVLFGAAVWSFVRWYEQPTLSARYGRDYEAYCSGVPAWRPRLRPWQPPRD